MNQSDIRVLCLMSLHRALLGKVFSKMRQGMLSINDKCVLVTWVVDGALSEEEEELLSEVETELLADLADEYVVHTEIAQDDQSSQKSEIFFLRHQGSKSDLGSAS
jgi:hypothetical protein